MSLLLLHCHASILSCSPLARSAQEGAGRRVGARWWIWLMNVHHNPLWFPCVEIKASPRATVEEKEPQDPPHPLTSAAAFRRLIASKLRRSESP